MDRFRKLTFPAWCGTAVVLYALAALRGWGAVPAKDGFQIPPSVRQGPGGYRSPLFWRGGK